MTADDDQFPDDDPEADLEDSEDEFADDDDDEAVASDLDDDFDDDADGDDEVDIDKVVELTSKEQSARTLEIRRAIEERREARRLHEDVDYLDLDLDD